MCTGCLQHSRNDHYTIYIENIDNLKNLSTRNEKEQQLKAITKTYLGSLEHRINDSQDRPIGNFEYVIDLFTRKVDKSVLHPTRFFLDVMKESNTWSDFGASLRSFMSYYVPNSSNRRVLNSSRRNELLEELILVTPLRFVVSHVISHEKNIGITVKSLAVNNIFNVDDFMLLHPIFRIFDHLGSRPFLTPHQEKMLESAFSQMLSVQGPFLGAIMKDHPSGNMMYRKTDPSYKKALHIFKERDNTRRELISSRENDGNEHKKEFVIRIGEGEYPVKDSGDAKEVYKVYSKSLYGIDISLDDEESIETIRAKLVAPPEDNKTDHFLDEVMHMVDLPEVKIMIHSILMSSIGDIVETLIADRRQNCLERFNRRIGQLMIVIFSLVAIVLSTVSLVITVTR